MAATETLFALQERLSTGQRVVELDKLNQSPAQSEHLQRLHRSAYVLYRAGGTAACSDAFAPMKLFKALVLRGGFPLGTLNCECQWGLLFYDAQVAVLDGKLQVMWSGGKQTQYALQGAQVGSFKPLHLTVTTADRRDVTLRFPDEALCRRLYSSVLALSSGAYVFAVPVQDVNQELRKLGCTETAEMELVTNLLLDWRVLVRVKPDQFFVPYLFKCQRVVSDLWLLNWDDQAFCSCRHARRYVVFSHVSTADMMELLFVCCVSHFLSQASRFLFWINDFPFFLGGGVSGACGWREKHRAFLERPRVDGSVAGYI